MALSGLRQCISCLDKSQRPITWQRTQVINASMSLKSALNALSRGFKSTSGSKLLMLLVHSAPWNLHTTKSKTWLTKPRLKSTRDYYSADLSPSSRTLCGALTPVTLVNYTPLDWTNRLWYATIVTNRLVYSISYHGILDSPAGNLMNHCHFVASLQVSHNNPKQWRASRGLESEN
jgi:hypothetical protein